MPVPIGLQLYTLREAMADDFEGVVRKVADIGYAGVEPAGFPGTTPEAASALFRDLGLEVPSAHLPLPIGDKKQETLDTAATLGTRRVISGQGPDNFQTIDLVKESCDRFNEGQAAAAENGMTFGIHNHWWEFIEVEGRLVYQVMLECLAPEIFFEVDTYWVQTAGVDPATVVRELGARAPILHVKDGPCVREENMTALGEGKVDFPGITEAGKAHTEWMIVELDRCDTDMMEAVVKSYQYMVGEGLVRGTKG